MELLKVAIVEDNALVAKDIQIKVEKIGFSVAGLAKNGNELKALLQDVKPDVLLMDIDLNDKENGIDLAEEIQHRHNIPVIFVTGLRHDVIKQQAYKTKPFGYLSKPLQLNDLKSTIELAVLHSNKEVQLMGTNAQPIFFKDDSKLIGARLEHILWLDADGSYCKIHMKNNPIPIHKSMSMGLLLSKLDCEYLVRIHKSTAVNLMWVDKIQDNQVFIAGQKLPIGKHYREEFLSKLNTF